MGPPVAHWPTVAMNVTVHLLSMAPTASTKLTPVMATPAGTLAPARYWRLGASGELLARLDLGTGKILTCYGLICSLAFMSVFSYIPRHFYPPLV